MHILYPSDPFNKSVADEAYAEEFDAWRALGQSCSLFSFEDFEVGEFKPKPMLATGESVLYRGWMVAPEMYARLHSAICTKGGVPITDPAQYRGCHYLPEWYSLCEDITPETVIVPKDADFVSALAGKDWPAYFVKDYLKSLTIPRGSIAATPEDVAVVVSLIEQYRGAVEGGVCIRRFEKLAVETEERYFVFNGRAYAREENVPPLVQDVAKRIKSSFFSVDVVTSESGELRLIELGDGQVSDRKKWPADKFASMLLEG